MQNRGVTRRRFLTTAVLMAGWGAARAGERNAGRPNLLIIHTDQQSCWTLGCYGGNLVETPHIDSLAENGALFSNFFTNSAVCTPSRGCLLTGRYPHSHGAYQNNIELGRDEITIAHALAKAGFETGYAGKWHLDGEPKPGWVAPERAMGFQDARYMFNRGHWKKITDAPGEQPKVHPYKVIGDEQTYTTDWLTEKTLDFLKRERTKPFFFMVSYPDPHTPFTVRTPYDTMYQPENMPLPETRHQKDLPEWAVKGASRCPKDDRLREMKARYCGEVKCIDDNVGRLIACLRETGQLENTIIVFTTDHGEYMGEHGQMGKNQLYETAYRIPFIVSWPKGIEAGRRITHCVSTVDVMPTLLGLAGIEGSGREQGYDASPVLLGKQVTWPDEAFIHHSSLDRAGVFTPKYELAFVRGGGHILFDRLNDPEQVKNLFEDPAYKDVTKTLGKRVLEHNIAVNAPAAEWLKDVVQS